MEITSTNPSEIVPNTISSTHDKKKILLTGIGGSIGTHFFAHIMKNTDWHIVGVESFRHKGWSERITHMFKEHSDWRERLTIMTHDLTGPFSPLAIKELSDIDYVVSMAALSDVEASIKNPVPFIKNNVDLVINLLELARQTKPEVFIQISTDEVYGAVETKEDKGMKEWAPIIPSNPYAASKACQEAIAISYWRTYGVPLIITNTMNNFGEMQQPNKFPVMIQKWIEKGEKVIIHGESDGQIGSRSYIHSRNFSDAILFILKNLKPHMHNPLKADKPDRYNIAGDKQLDNQELAQLIADLMGKELNYEIQDSHVKRPGHDPHYQLDDGKLRKLGWKSPIDFETSLKNTIEWQQSNPNWIQ